MDNIYLILSLLLTFLLTIFGCLLIPIISIIYIIFKEYKYENKQNNNNIIDINIS